MTTEATASPPGAGPVETTVLDWDEARDAGAIERLVPDWRRLAVEAARSGFESPDWLVPWWRHYGAGREPHVLTWWREGELVGVAPLVLGRVRRGPLATRELELWGATRTPLRGWVDVLARDDVRTTVAEELATRLAIEPGWDLGHYLRLPAGSPTVEALRAAGRPWWHVRLTGAVRSWSWVVDLPAEPTGWSGYLGPKARHEIRRSIRRFGEQAGGRIERLTDPDVASEVAGALRRLLAARWGEREAYFRVDPAFEPFLVDALCSTLASGSADVLVARDRDGIAACLVTLTAGRRTTALVIGVSPDPRYRPFSLGKALFHRAIDDAVEAGARAFDFLAVGGYKERFWHARPERLESGIVARGPLGTAVAAYAAVRHGLVRRAVRRLRRGRGGSVRLR